MKRLLAFIMAAMLIVSGTVFASETDGTKREYSAALEEAVALMDKLEVMQIENDGEDEVTRADFAVCAARLIKVNEYAKSDASTAYYYDVPSTHWAAVCVNNLAEIGALTVGDDKMFRPDDTITVTEASKIILTILGYNAYASMQGGYPAGYIAAAKKLGLYDNISDGGVLTKYDAAVILSNAATTVVAEVLPYKDSVQHKQSESTTILEVYHDMYAVRGRLETVNETSIYPGTSLENSAEIDGVTYRYYGDTDLVGCDVKAYYTKPRGGEAEIAFMLSKTDKSDILEISAEDLVGFDEDWHLSYYDENDRAKTVNIERNAAVIYNGICAESGIVDLVNNTKEGSIRVIKSKNNGYDTLIIRSCETIVAGYVDNVAKKVFDSADAARAVDLSENVGTVVIRDENGNKTVFSSIKKNSVLAVYENGNKRVEVWVCAETVFGKYTGESSRGSKKYLVIDGAKYEVYNKYYDKFKAKLVTGQEMTFLTDMQGRIVGVTDVSSGGDYIFGYYLKYAEQNASLDDGVVMKLYTQSEGIKSYKLAEKVKIDGSRYTKEQTVAALDNSFNKAQTELEKFSGRPTNSKTRVIRYKLNDSNVITDIDTPYCGEDESENSLRIFSAEKGVDYIWVGIIGYATTFNSNTVLFQVPEENELQSADNKMFYSATGVKSIGTNQSIIGYKTSIDSGVCDLIVNIAQVDAELSLARNVMVSDFETTVDEEGTPTDCIVGWNTGNEVRYTVSPDAVNDKGQKISPREAGIEKGDLLILSFNAANEVDKYSCVYDCSENKTYTPSGMKVFTKDDSIFYAGERMTFGYPVRIYDDGVIDLSYTKGGAVNESYPASSIAVTVYDKSLRTDNIYKGSISDVATYENAGANCSAVIVHAQYAVWKSYYVYK